MRLEEVKSLYFLGVGGIGMSALARYFHQRGVAVAGYDKTETALTKKLVEEGMTIHYKDDPEQIPRQVDLVVYTPAIPGDLQEWRFVQQQSLPVKKRAEVLGMISRGRPTVAIAGTHGKTTTSSITAHLLAEGGIGCTAFLGGIAGNFGSNYFHSGDDWVVVEADEFDRSFLHLRPQLAVILSMDADHLDIYGDAESLRRTGFEAFARCVRPGGLLYLREGLEVAVPEGVSLQSFGLGKGECRSENVRVEDGRFVFDYRGPGGTIRDLRWDLPGQHNVENATAAISIALRVGVHEENIRRALAGFKGIRRRFEWIVRMPERVYIDDYAHHPVELQATIAAARALFPGRRITGIFQPHLYSRTRDFAEEFGQALSALDELWLLPIYPAREEPIPGVSAASIAEHVEDGKCRMMKKNEVLPELRKKQPEVLLTLGAGDIDRLVEPIKEMIK